MARLPFALRRPYLLCRDLLVDRERPDLGRLRRVEHPEAFVWAVLPHAARTFSACIALLPAATALPAAVAYLYCRMLDTYEDLVPDPAARDEALRAFAERLDAGLEGAAVAPAPPIEESTDRDERDRAHLLLVERCALVDRVFLGFRPEVRAAVRDLVRDMSEGMRWSSATFERQGSVLRGEEQLAAYCRHVLGNPVLFTVRVLRLHATGCDDLAPDEREASMRVGELIQLANVTRDIEKDLARGVAYHASLAGDLRQAPEGDPARIERCRAVRAELLRMALLRAPSYRNMVDAMRLPAVSLARASAVLMLLFTDRYYRSCAARAGLPSWPGPRGTTALLLRSFPATWSRAWAHRQFARVERAFAAAADHSRTARPTGPRARS